MTENGKNTIKQINDPYGFSPTPWTGGPLTTNKGTIIINVRDAEGRLVAEVNELSLHAEANLSVLRAAPRMLERLKYLLMDCPTQDCESCNETRAVIEQAERHKNSRLVG